MEKDLKTDTTNAKTINALKISKFYENVFKKYISLYIHKQEKTHGFVAM